MLPFAASSRPLDGSVWQLSTMPAAQVPGHAPRSFVPTMHSVVPSVPHQANSTNIVFMQMAGHSQPPATQTMMPAFMSSAQSAVMEAPKSVPIVPTQPAHSPQIRQGQFPQGMTAPAAGACVQAPGAMIPAAVQTQAPRSMVPHITPAAQTAPMHMHIRQVLAPGSQAIVQALQVVPQVRPGQTVQNNTMAMPAFQVPTQAPPFQNPFAWTSPPAGVMCSQAANGKPQAGQPKTVCTIVHPPRAQAPPQPPAPALDLPHVTGIDDTGTGLMAARFGAGKQESDLLENLGKKYQQNPDAQVQLISLGSYCGPKLSFQKMGRGAATLPFDWIRTRMEGIIHFLRNDFEGFFDFVTQQRVPDTGLMVMFRGYYHSFWHDDPSDPSMHDRYNRRIAWLGEMSSDLGTQLLFVRSNVSHEEVLQVPELMKLLRAKFGKSSRLLLILENQQKFVGPALVDEDDHVMLHYLSMDVHKKSHPDNAMPYARPVECALDWCAEKVTCRHFSTFADAFQLADPYPGGERGLGGLPAFEATKVLATVEATGQKAVNRADLLETSRNPFDYEADKADKAEGMVLDAKMREPRTANHRRLKG